jgi:hypothetical protein
MIQLEITIIKTSEEYDNHNNILNTDMDISDADDDSNHDKHHHSGGNNSNHNINDNNNNSTNNTAAIMDIDIISDQQPRQQQEVHIDDESPISNENNIVVHEPQQVMSFSEMCDVMNSIFSGNQVVDNDNAGDNSDESETDCRQLKHGDKVVLNGTVKRTCECCNKLVSERTFRRHQAKIRQQEHLALAQHTSNTTIISHSETKSNPNDHKNSDDDDTDGHDGENEEDEDSDIEEEVQELSSDEEDEAGDDVNDGKDGEYTDDGFITNDALKELQQSLLLLKVKYGMTITALMAVIDLFKGVICNWSSDLTELQDLMKKMPKTYKTLCKSLPLLQSIKLDFCPKGHHQFENHRGQLSDRCPEARCGISRFVNRKPRFRIEVMPVRAMIQRLVESPEFAKLLIAGWMIEQEMLKNFDSNNIIYGDIFTSLKWREFRKNNNNQQMPWLQLAWKLFLDGKLLTKSRERSETAKHSAIIILLTCLNLPNHWRNNPLFTRLVAARRF